MKKLCAPAYYLLRRIPLATMWLSAKRELREAAQTRPVRKELHMSNATPIPSPIPDDVELPFSVGVLQAE